MGLCVEKQTQDIFYAKKVDDKKKDYLIAKCIQARRMYGIPKNGSHLESDDE